MTTIAEKLNTGGYVSHHFGKWHAGQATLAHTPYGRGFSTSLSFFNFGEDHFTQVRGTQATGFFEQPPSEIAGDVPTNCNLKGIDLWNHTQPAYGQNGTYGGYQFTQAAVNAIFDHDQTKPFFMFVAFQNIHPPLQVPQDFIDLYNNPELKTAVNGMASFLDESMGNVTKALKATGMWANTLVVFSADNGGYFGNGGDSSPYRGCKFSDFEGGTRVPSFATGGLIPVSQRGTTINEMIHIADWYSTFCHLAGVDPTDARAAASGFASIDSKNVWQMLSGDNATSPHSEIVLSTFGNTSLQNNSLHYFVSGEAIVTAQYKLVTGNQHTGPFGSPSNIRCGNGSHFPPSDPWGKSNPGAGCTCGEGCLFDLTTDPYERNDVSLQHPQVVADLQQRLAMYRKTSYSPDRGPIEQAACDQVVQNGGFFGPWLPSPSNWVFPNQQ